MGDLRRRRRNLNLEIMIEINSSNSLTINTKPIVRTITSIEIAGTGTELPVEVVADFSSVPTDLHGAYLEAFKYKYLPVTKVFDCTQESEEEVSSRSGRLDRLADIFLSAIKKR